MDDCCCFSAVYMPYFSKVQSSKTNAELILIRSQDIAEPAIIPSCRNETGMLLYIRWDLNTLLLTLCMNFSVNRRMGT